MNTDHNDKFSIFISSKSSKKQIKKINIEELNSNEKGSHLDSLSIEKDHVKQEILGFGGAFTESSSSIYKSLNPEKKEEIIEAYFGRTGNQYNMGRTHINSCDFSLENYAHCETPGDISLSTFSIERDKKMIIPFIKDAIKQSLNNIKILASPWSPPAWMKTNKEMNNGGKLITKYRSSWANYYCKYIEYYEREEIPIWGISIQNEPEAKQTWDSCLYSAEEERDFIKHFLGPALEHHGLLSKKVVIWDHNRDVMVERARKVLEDPIASKYVWGTGFHWYNGDHFEAVQQVHDEFPDKNLIFTEGCQENGPHIGSWKLGERYATSIINDLNRWTRAWLDWNLILNETGGPNHVGNYCSAPIIVDTQSDTILYQSSYYYIGHFSRFLKRGDQIVKSNLESKTLLALSSINKSDELTSVVMNKSDQNIDFTYSIDEIKLKLKIPSRSIITIIKKA